MRRRDIPADVRALDPTTDSQKPVPSPAEKRIRCLTFGTWALAAGLLVVALTRLVSEHGAKERIKQSERAIYNRSLLDAKTFLGNAQHEPVYGLTTGAYHTMAASCYRKLIANCGFDLAARGSPPAELLEPGKLQLRPDLSEESQCFLWYSASFWTRPTGGAKGVELSRQGGSVDNKVNLVKWVLDYNAKYGCPANQILPITLDLRDPRSCAAFLYNNSRWARGPSSLWFLKDPMGSTGRHIRLLRRGDVERMVGAVRGNWTRHAMSELKAVCNGSVAALGIEGMLTLHDHKFDHRVFVLIASVQPLIAFFHPGHLRFSSLKFDANTSSPSHRLPTPKWEYGQRGGRIDASATSDEDLARHVTNPRFGLAHANGSDAVLQRADVLVRRLDPSAKASVRRRQVQAMLQIVFAVRHRFEGRGSFSEWGHAWLAADVVYDTAFNPYVVDVNTGPSFYHSEEGKEWPGWFREERSAMVRGAQDTLQGIAFRKRARRWAIAQHQKKRGAAAGGVLGQPPGLGQLAEPGVGGWTLVYSELEDGDRNSGNRSITSTQLKLVPGQCAMKEPLGWPAAPQQMP